MTLRDVMTRHVETVSPDSMIAEAARKMKDMDVGPMPVCDGDRIVGMLTDRDITIRATAEGKDPNQTRVRDVMTPDVVYCYEDDDVNAAARIMQQKQLRRLLVMDRNKRLVGIVSLGDLAVETDDEEMSGQVLEAVSEPASPTR